ncbi:MAG: type I DNA topoisomerase [Flavobacteriales bacterium]|nr:type I DNA topoisomerase [Flavobacteriales bacterium]
MTKNLVIVESPAKAKTIEKFLGNDFTVKSCFGHIRDLVKGDDAIDVSAGYAPKYEVPADKKAVVNDLKKLAKQSEMVWLASDEDREGEAISWHLSEVLGLKKENTKRIVFHEITKPAILKAIENPRQIDEHLVDAQQARRILDRLVGFKLSPVLWRKVKPSLSAGRVQSVAVRLVVEREREIENFKSESFFRVIAHFIEKGKKFKAECNTKFKTKAQAEAFLETCKNANFNVTDVEVKPVTKRPAPPFTTSTLQQEASRKLGYSVSRTMQIAQRLYENGHITYMRTDSENLSDLALNTARQEIVNEYGQDYAQTRKYNTKSAGAQEAHEAIRPTYFSNRDAGSDSSENRLYQLIWKRAIASQMSDAQLERTIVKINNDKNEHIFTANGEVLKFEGFLKVYLEGNDEEEEEAADLLPPLARGDNPQNERIVATQRFSRPPARYTEASLVRKLEELGIGRPSTYAPTISTIQKREYVEKGTSEGIVRNFEIITLKDNNISQKSETENTGSDKNKLIPSDIGKVVTDFLIQHFDQIMDYNFTASVEKEFDEIASGMKQWNKMIDEFYNPFNKTVDKTLDTAERATGERILGIDPETGKEVIARLGRFGSMVQIGKADDNYKPKFAGLNDNQTIDTITLDEALSLFKYPKTIGSFEGKEIVIGQGRFGPYVKFDDKFISIPRGEEMESVGLQRAIEIIKEKQKADAPIAQYEGHEVQKGTGRFGPFIKWNGIFINVSRKYDFENLTSKDVAELIEDKKKKEVEKYVHNWSSEGISVQKARWGRHHIVKGKTKIELQKTFDVSKLTLDEAKKMIEAEAAKKKSARKK